MLLLPPSSLFNNFLAHDSDSKVITKMQNISRIYRPLKTLLMQTNIISLEQFNKFYPNKLVLLKYEVLNLYMR